jgi:tRNA A-37 threonylcarbamoyl transferase component Bud32
MARLSQMRETMQRSLHAQPLGRGWSLVRGISETLPSLLRELPAAWSRTTDPKTAECLSEDEILNFTEGTLGMKQVRRVDDHLSHCNTCSYLVSELLGELSLPSSSHPQFPLIPFVFSPSALVADRFSIRRLVGRGGMGEVYEAVDLESEQVVALKTVLAARSDSRDAMARLTLELHATREIEHENVCKAREMGLHEDVGLGSACLRFITMDFIAGETLGQRLRRAGPIPLPQALATARAVLCGLAATHQARIVHLDIKSDNVMLPERDDRRRAILIDFGLAQAFGKDDRSRSSTRGHGGTVSYMAPEQMLGEPRGTHTDVFGFGVVLFEMLTGTHPFGSRSHSMSLTRSLRLAELPLRPARLLREVPAALDELVARCTSADPKDRPADAPTALSQFNRIG